MPGPAGFAGSAPGKLQGALQSFFRNPTAGAFGVTGGSGGNDGVTVAAAMARTGFQAAPGLRA